MPLVHAEQVVTVFGRCHRNEIFVPTNRQYRAPGAHFLDEAKFRASVAGSACGAFVLLAASVRNLPKIKGEYDKSA